MFLGSYTIATFRDEVRRQMDQIPAIDDSTGVAGAQPARWPYPTNPDINAKLALAMTWVSRKVHRLFGDAVPRLIPIPAQTASGPYYIPLWDISPGGSIDNVRRAAWLNASGGQEFLLIPDNRDNLDRNRQAIMTQVPATPQRTWIEGGNFMIWPAPSAEGILSLLLGQQFGSQLQGLDGEAPATGLPNDFAPILVYKTAIYLCEQQFDDVVFQARAALLQKEIDDLLPDLQAFISRRNRSFESRLVPMTGRTGRLLGRR